MSILTATVTKVKIGPVSMDGLMSENGDFAIALPQVSEHFRFPNKHAARTVKPMLGEGFQFPKWKTELNPKAVNVIPLAEMEKLILELALQGNEAAIAFSRALIGLSLHQLFCDAFGKKFEKEDRQRWLTERMESKHNFRPLTDQLQRHGFKDRSEYARFVWGMQTKAGIKSGERDTASAAQLSRLNVLQTRAMTLMECGVKPWEVLRRL